MKTLCALPILLSLIVVVTAIHDYVKYGRVEEGPFPSSLGNIPYYCYQAPSKGPCARMYKVYFFDIVRRKCMPMFYSGCGGNENRFNSESECKIHCEPKRLT